MSHGIIFVLNVIRVLEAGGSFNEMVRWRSGPVNLLKASNPYTSNKRTLFVMYLARGKQTRWSYGLILKKLLMLVQEDIYESGKVNLVETTERRT